MGNKTALHDLIGIEHHKLNFFQELQQNIQELKGINRESEDQRCEIAAILDGITDVMMVLSEDLTIISVNRVLNSFSPASIPLARNATPCSGKADKSARNVRLSNPYPPTRSARIRRYFALTAKPAIRHGSLSA